MSTDHLPYQDPLSLRGYAITSRKFQHAARIDRPDWIHFMVNEKGYPTDTPLGLMADQYRRVYSKDRIRVPDNVDLRNSNDGPTVYLP